MLGGSCPHIFLSKDFLVLILTFLEYCVKILYISISSDFWHPLECKTSLHTEVLLEFPSILHPHQPYPSQVRHLLSVAFYGRPVIFTYRRESQDFERFPEITNWQAVKVGWELR